MDYEPVEAHVGQIEEKTPWKPFLRQLLVASNIWLFNFMWGMWYGLPTVMVPQIRKAANSTDAVSDNMASWIYSVCGFSSLAWLMIVCVCMKYIGRKIPFAFGCLNMLACYILLYFSTSLTHILIAQFMQGISQSFVVSLNIIIVLEYTSPVYRGVFTTLKAVSFFWGIWVSNAIGTFFAWSNVPLLGIFSSLYFLTVVFWHESPQWLASKGEYGKCRIEHRWLRGTHPEAERELEKLIQSQIDYRKNFRQKKNQCFPRRVLNTIRLKEFYKPVLLTIVLMLQYVSTGKMIIVIYVLDIIKNITSSEHAAYVGMLILDGITLIALCTGSYLSKILNRRTLLFSSCSMTFFFLFVISLYLYLAESKLIMENKIVSLALLMLFSIFCCGPMIMLVAIAGEVTPLQYKSSITMISGTVFSAFGATAIKLFPIMSNAFHLSGTFLFHGVITMLTCLFLYKYMPETKDKTLQEIQDFFTGKKSTREGTDLLQSNNLRV